MAIDSPIDQIGWTVRFAECVAAPTLHQLKILRQSWWFNPTNTHSMRLSDDGFRFATTRAEIKHYSHDLDRIILPKTLVQLERSLLYPYYVAHYKTIKVLDEAMSVTLILYDNNLQTYLDNVQKFQ